MFHRGGERVPAVLTEVGESVDKERERSGGEDTIFREKQINKVNGVPVLVIRQPPSSCVKSLFLLQLPRRFSFCDWQRRP